MIVSDPVTRCSFAMSGTYGHECEKPATKIAVMECKSTADGLFYAGRCDRCAKIKGGENSRIIRWEPVRGQRNRWE
jgi:hypothetical protein